MNFKKQLEHAKEYLKISKKLYEVIREIANRRKNSKLAKTIKEAKILDFKSTNNLKQDVEKTEIWLKNFNKVNGGYNSVWNDNIASAIQKLSKIKISKIFDFIKRNIPQVSGKICNILKKINEYIDKQTKQKNIQKLSEIFDIKDENDKNAIDKKIELFKNFYDQIAILREISVTSEEITKDYVVCDLSRKSILIFIKQENKTYYFEYQNECLILKRMERTNEETSENITINYNFNI